MYDSRGNRKSAIYTSGIATSATYDAYDNVLTSTTPERTVTTNEDWGGYGGGEAEAPAAQEHKPAGAGERLPVRRLRQPHPEYEYAREIANAGNFFGNGYNALAFNCMQVSVAVLFQSFRHLGLENLTEHIIPNEANRLLDILNFTRVFAK